MPAIDLHKTPGMAPPPGVTAHPLDNSPIPVSLTITATICLFLTTTAICARMFTKAYDLRHVQVEDYAIVFAGLGFIAWTGVLFDGTVAGQGHHLWNVSKAGVKRTALLSNILAIVYIPVMFAAKLAVLLQISRIFAGIQKNFIFWSVRVLIALNFLAYLGIFFARVFACVPRAKISDPTVPGHCISQSGSIVATGVVNAVSDLMILALPLYGVWGLQMAPKRKLAIAAVFGTGLLACVASLVRLVVSIRLDEDPDFTMGIWPVDMWALAEFTCVILVACFPTFPRLLKYIQGRVQKRRASRYGSQTKWPSNPSNIKPASSPSSTLKNSAERDAEPMHERSGASSGASSQTAVEAPEKKSKVGKVKKPKPAYTKAPLSFASIRKTVEVRLSNHTGPKTPGTPEFLKSYATPFEGT